MPALVTSSDTGGTTTKTVAPAPSPTIYWLDGKAYYTLSSYQAALAAKAAATKTTTVAQPAPAPAPAPAPIIAKAPIVAAPAPVLSTSNAAALAAAEAARREQVEARAEALRQLQMKQLAYRRSMELRALAAANASPLAIRRAQDAVTQAREAETRIAQQKLEAARHKAYEALTERSRALQFQLRDRQRQVEERADTEDQQVRAARYQAAAKRPTVAEGWEFNRSAQPRVDLERRRVVAEASSTGNWQKAIDILDKQSRDTGGRYVDQKLLDVVQERYVDQVILVGERYQDAMNQARALLEAKDIDGLFKLMDSADFMALEKQAAEYFGIGRGPGSFAVHARILTDIAERRERLWAGLTLDPSGRTTSEAGINRLIAKAKEQSTVRYNRGGFQESSDFSRSRDLTYNEQVLDPETGETKTVQRVGFEAYLAREAARNQDRTRLQLLQQTQRLQGIRKMAALEGRPVDASIDAQGRQVVTDQISKRTLEEVLKIIPGGAKRFDAIVNAKSEALREQLIRNFLRDAAGAYDRTHLSREGAERAAATHGRYGVGSIAQRNAWLTEVKRLLMGADAGEYGLMDDFSQSYGLGDIFRAAMTPLASGISSIRQMRAEGLLGNKPDFNRPFIDASLYGEKGLQFSAGQMDDPNGKAAYDEYIRGINDPDPNVQANARRAYGLGYIGGNLGWIAEGALDPLNFVSPAAWLNRVRVATVSAQGLSGLSRLGKSLSEFARYSTPKLIGGHGSSKLRIDLAKIAMAKHSDASASAILHMTDAEFKDMAEKVVRGTAELEASDGFAKLRALVDPAKIDREQLLNIVQDRLPKIAEEYRLLAVDPFELHARIRAAREGFARAEQQAKEAVQLEARRVAQAEAKVALEKVRLQSGIDVGERVAVSAADLAEHEARLARYVGTAREYAAVAAKANRAADELEKMGTVAAADRRRIPGLYAQLDRHLKEMTAFEDSYVVQNGESKLAHEGLVAKHYRELAEHRMTLKGDPSAPSFVGLSWRVVRQDRRLLVSRIRGLQRALASAKTADEMTAIRRQLVEAHKARIGVEYEAALLDRGRSMARGYGRKNASRVSAAYRPQRLGQKALNEAERATEASRDLSNRLGAVGEVVDAPARSAKTLASDAVAAHELAAVSGRDVVDYIGKLMRGKVGVKFGKTPAADVIADLERLASALGTRLEDLSLDELLVALYRVRRAGGDPEAWLGAWKVVENRVASTLRASHWVGSVEDYIAELGWQHVRSGKQALGLKAFEAADKSVSDALFELRGTRATGQLRGGTKRYSDGAVRDMIRPDSDPAVVLTKMRALRDHGLDVFEYDRLRGVLKDVMLRRNTQVGLLEDAKKIVARDGLSLDEAYIKAREVRAAQESLREFEEFATRLENQGRAPEQVLRLFEERYVSTDLGPAVMPQLTSYQVEAMRAAWRETAGFEFDDAGRRAEWLQGAEPPPLGNRVAMRDYLREHGYWSPRTAEQIASGERVWSIADERSFFERNWGYTPPWTDPEVMAVVLRDRRGLKAAFDEWGFFEDGYETVMSELDLKAEQALDAVVWGREGLAAKRTLPELRSWAVQRYGELVGTNADGVITLTEMPWLMTEAEYIPWMERALSESGRAARMSELEVAMARLPEVIRDAMPEGDTLERFGVQVDRGMVKVKEIDKLNAAIVKSVKRRLERLTKDRDLDPGVWLPQEQLRFAYDVTNELLADPVWRGLLRGTPVIGAALHLVGQLQRALVSLQIAFPVMNLIETYGPRRLLLAVFNNGFKPLSLELEGKRLVGTLREIGAESGSLFHLADGAHPWLRVGDKFLPATTRAKALFGAVTTAPLQASKFGEDMLRLDFGRSVAGRAYRDAIKTGMEVGAAEALARAEAKRVVGIFFSTGKTSSFMRELNNVIPFFSYNWNNKKLALVMIWQHPAIVAWGERMADAIKEMNRDAWDEEHPGVPFPEDDPSSSWLWIKSGDDFYTIDLAQFSDWTRALKSVMSSQNAFEWANSWLRAPHPSQLAMLALLTDGVTPWGKPGHIRELSFWPDLLLWMNGVDYEDPRWQRNWVEITSQMLFFKKFGRITSMKAKLQQYFWFRDLDPKKAYAYLNENPDLQIYFDNLAGSDRATLSADRITSWRSLMSREERAEYDSSYEEWKALNKALDARIFKYANQPWSPEYSAANREALIARTEFLRQHPILPDAWGVFMAPGEFGSLQDSWKVDVLADAWFNWKRPARDAFANELAYQRALVAYYDKREIFLKANPALLERLLAGRNAVENAWREHELHWSSILQFQAELKVRILEEQERPDADRGLVDLLYRVRDAAGLELDAESYAEVYGAVVPGGMLEQGRVQAFANFVGATGSQLIKRIAELPGFSDFIYGRSTPEERANIERNEWYARGIAKVMSTAKDGKSFYAGLFANPALLQEYWRRNPDAKARYQAGQQYFRWISSWVGKLKGDDFVSAQAVWDAMPAWVRERYLNGHPDSGMADGKMGGGGSAFEYKGLFFKSAESRDRYIKGGSFEQSGVFFKSAESRARFVRGQEYYASVGKWVELLKAKDYVEADRYFRSMPEWMREKYYAKHPDQRAQHELDSEALRYGAEYFLASGDDKLAILAKYPALRQWLAQHGGEEAAFRGLVTSMYKAIPSNESWLKRTFRERFPEIFSQEALGARRLASVARDLAETPELAPFYEKAFALQSRLFMEQLKLSKSPPKPWEMERVKRAKKRSRRRGARMHSHWTLHQELRHQN